MSLENDMRTLAHALDADAKAGRGESVKALTQIVHHLAGDMLKLRAELDALKSEVARDCHGGRRYT